jgi:hypothetical protein
LKSYQLSFEEKKQCSCPHCCHDSLFSHICINLEHTLCMLEGLYLQKKFLNIHLYRLLEEVNLKSYQLSFQDQQQCSCPHGCHNSLVYHIFIHREHTLCMPERLNLQQKLFLEPFPLSPQLWNMLHLSVHIQDPYTWASPKKK